MQSLKLRNTLQWINSILDPDEGKIVDIKRYIKLYLCAVFWIKKKGEKKKRHERVKSPIYTQ